MNFMKVSCVIAQAQCLTNWADKERLRARLTFETMKQLFETFSALAGTCK